MSKAKEISKVIFSFCLRTYFTQLQENKMVNDVHIMENVSYISVMI